MLCKKELGKHLEFGVFLEIYGSLHRIFSALAE